MPGGCVHRSVRQHPEQVRGLCRSHPGQQRRRRQQCGPAGRQLDRQRHSAQLPADGSDRRLLAVLPEVAAGGLRSLAEHLHGRSAGLHPEPGQWEDPLEAQREPRPAGRQHHQVGVGPLGQPDGAGRSDQLVGVMQPVEGVQEQQHPLLSDRVLGDRRSCRGGRSNPVIDVN